MLWAENRGLAEPESGSFDLNALSFILCGHIHQGQKSRNHRPKDLNESMTQTSGQM